MALAGAAGAVEAVGLAGLPALDGVADFGDSDLLTEGGFFLGGAPGVCAEPLLPALAGAFVSDGSAAVGADDAVEVEGGGAAVAGGAFGAPVV